MILNLVSSLHSNLRACARVLAVLLVLAISIAAIGIKVSVARAEEGLLELGRHLEVMAEHGLGKDSRGISLNGQVLGFRVLTTEQSLQSSLDFYERWCRDGRGSFEEQLDGVHWIDESSTIERNWRDLTLRKDEDHRGFVTCLHHPGQRRDAEALSDSIERFQESGELSDIGRFHYVYATDYGDHRLLIMVWTAGAFYPLELFPSEGDAPGSDVPGVPRCGRRSLAANELDEPGTLNVYIDCGESVGELVQRYRTELARNQWRILADTPTEDGDQVLVVERANSTFFITIGRHAGTSWVAVGGGIL